MMDIDYLYREGALRLFAFHEVDNYGDRLGPALFHLVTKRPVCIEARGLELTFDQGAPRTIYCFLGTTAQFLSGPHRFVLWGLGSAPPQGPDHHGCRPVSRGLNLQIYSLRGPLTKQILLDAGYQVPADVPYGDPALLVPYFYKRSPYQVDDFCIVPHHALYREWRDKLPGFNVIDINLKSYEQIQQLILEITKYKAVFSSSLHVTILAECFGIPTCPVAPRLSFKFDDFYASGGKTVVYVPELRPDIDWWRLFEDTVGNWQPFKWDPLPWLDSSPFPIEAGLRECLKSHYHNLAQAKTPEDFFTSTERGQDSLRNYYRLVQPQKQREDDEIHKQATVLLIVNRRQDLDVVMDGQMVADEGDGIRIKAASTGAYVATRFIAIKHNCKIRVEVKLRDIIGVVLVLVQNEKYATVKYSVVDYCPSSIQNFTIWPTEDTDLRVCIVPLLGTLVVEQIAIILAADGGQPASTLDAPAPKFEATTAQDAKLVADDTGTHLLLCERLGRMLNCSGPIANSELAAAAAALQAILGAPDVAQFVADHRAELPAATLPLLIINLATAWADGNQLLSETLERLYGLLTA